MKTLNYETFTEVHPSVFEKLIKSDKLVVEGSFKHCLDVYETIDHSKVELYRSNDFDNDSLVFAIILKK